jgi:exodeoxyribonuclease-3
MLRVISVNVNGIRAAARKGLFEWFLQAKPDVICIQETKAQENQLDDDAYRLPGYHRYFHDAQKKGYSGVAIYSKVPPEKVTIGLGWGIADNEGRYIQLDFEALSIASLYLPSGSSGDVRQAVKYDFLERYEKYLVACQRKKRDFIVCGDFNIVHKEIDIRNWKGNQKNSGCLPEERAWLDKLFGPMGYVDTFRELNQGPDQFTWWSNRGQSWAKNVGWRIDYQITTSGLKNKLIATDIYKAERFSDHAPLIVDYDVDLR